MYFMMFRDLSKFYLKQIFIIFVFSDFKNKFLILNKLKIISN